MVAGLLQGSSREVCTAVCEQGRDSLRLWPRLEGRRAGWGCVLGWAGGSG